MRKSIGYGVYANTEYGQFDPFGIPGADGCDSSRANTCGIEDAQGNTTCFDERGCPIYKEGGGKLTVLAKQGTKVGKEFLQDRIKAAESANESLLVDMFGKKTQIGPAQIPTGLLIGGGVAILAIVLLVAFRPG